MRLITVILLVACLRGACAFVLWPACRQESLTGITTIDDLMNATTADGQPVFFRWPAHLDLLNSSGLGLGITYAYDPDFFDEMLPHFREGNQMIQHFKMVTGNSIRQLVGNAFASWSMHNPHVRFVDVTDLCDGNWRDVSNSVTPKKRECDKAEIIITTYDQSESDIKECPVGAAVKPFEYLDKTPLSTNEQMAHGGSVTRFTLQYATNQCWYIDSTFCEGFYRMDGDGVDGLALMTSMLVIMLMCGICGLGYTLFAIFMAFLRTLLKSFDKDGDGLTVREILGGSAAGLKQMGVAVKKAFKGEFKAAMAGNEGDVKLDIWDAVWAVIEIFAKLQLTRVVLLVFIFAFPIIFYYQIFEPCWQCKDFQAASVHTVGRILGLDHSGGLEDDKCSKFKIDYSSYDCHNVTATASIDASTDKDALMYAFDTHSPRSCLTQDDLDGLNFLYPVCEGRIEEPQCKIVRLNIGFIRLFQGIMAAELIPWCIFVFIKICCIIALMLHRKSKEAVTKVRSMSLRPNAPG